MKCAISGSHGFIGSHLVQHLESHGDEVLRIDRSLFSSFDELKDVLTDFNPARIYHLAAYGNHSNQNDIDMMISTNIFSLYLLLRQTRKIKYDAFINVSTSSVNLPHQTFYSATKAAGERIASVFAQTYEKPVVTVRPASVYGTGEEGFRFIPRIIECLGSNERMQIVKDATHSWIYIDDFIRALLLVGDRAHEIKEPINISNNETVSNIDVIRHLEAISRKTLRYEVIPSLRDYDTTDWIVGNASLKLLGYQPKYSLEEGLRKTYEYYHEYYR